MSEIYIPREYQKDVIKFGAARNYAGLFLDPGLGKTSISLAILQILRKYQGKRKALISAPIAVMNTTWPDEIAQGEQFSGLRFEIIGGNRRQRYKALANKNADIYLINPENMSWFVGVGGIHRQDFDVLFVDESTRYKNSGSVRFLDMIGGRGSEWSTSILPHFSNRYILTGTPIPKGLLDLWAQIFILDGGKHLGKNITRYRKRWFNESVYGNYRHYEPTPFAKKEIQELIKPFVVRKKAEDHIDMPELLEYEVEVELPPKIMRHYKQLESELFLALEEKQVVAANAGVLTGKLQQFAQGAIYPSEGPFDPVAELKPGKVKPFEELHNEKLERLDLLLDELEGQPVIVAYAFKHDAVRLEKYLKNRFSNQRGNYMHLGAGSDGTKFNEAKTRWNNKELDVLQVQPSIVAHGLNIQYGGHHIIMFGNTWNFEDYDQLIRRLYRPGQPNHKVVVHRMVAKGTIDKAMIMNLHNRGSEQEGFMVSLQNYKKQTLVS